MDQQLLEFIQILLRGTDVSEKTKEELANKGYTMKNFLALAQIDERICLEKLQNLHFLEADAIFICTQLRLKKKEIAYQLENPQFNYYLATSKLVPSNNFHIESKENDEFEKFDKLKTYLARHNNSAITIVNRNLLCTYADKDHSGWKVGEYIENVELFDNTRIECKISKVNTRFDCIWLRPIDNLPPMIEDLKYRTPYIGEELILIGLYGKYQVKAAYKEIKKDFRRVSFDIANASCYVFDHNNHKSTNIRGDSGAPLFDYYDMSFVGMMTSEPNTEPKFLPSELILSHAPTQDGKCCCGRSCA